MYEPAEVSAAVQQKGRGRSALVAPVAPAKCPRGPVSVERPPRGRVTSKFWGRKPPSGEESDPPRGCGLAGGWATRRAPKKPDRHKGAEDGSNSSSG